MELFLKIFPNGCSHRQLDMLHNKVFQEYGNPYMDRSVSWPVNIRKLEQIRSSLQMYSSCYVYGQIDKWKTKYYFKYLEDYEKLGGSKDDFNECIGIYEKHLRKSSVMCNIHTDGEGVSYNGIRESDEPCNYNYL